MTTEDLMKLADKFAFFMPGSEEGEKARQALLDALQSQAERIKELELRIEVQGSVNADLIKVIETLSAQLAALQVDDELPEPATWGLKDFVTRCERPLFTADQLRQHAAQVRAKMVPLEKDAARYRWLRERYTAVNFDWEESGQQAVIFTADDFPIASASCDETIDAAMGITGEPK